MNIKIYNIIMTFKIGKPIIIKEYLSKNIICQWEIIKKNKPLTNYNIISCVFFIKKEAYKDITYYTNGLINIINNFSNIFINFRLRIYYDETVINILDTLLKDKNLDNIELYKYNIKLFKDEQFHKGTIGTFMRFLPLFNFKYHKVDKCIVFDIDNKIHKFYTKIINYFNANNIKIAYRSRFCYINKRIIYTKNKYPIIASFIYQSIQIPSKYFSDFFEKLYIENDQKIIKYINKSDINNIYEYGIDELFLNKYYIKYIIKNEIDFSLLLFNHIDIYTGFYKFVQLYCDKKNIRLKVWKIMIYFYNIINIDLLKFYKNKNINNELILEMLDNNKNFMEKQLIIKIKNKNNLNKLKKYIFNELKNINNKKIIYLLNCIYNNLNIKSNKINIALVNNNKIKSYYLLNF